MLTVTAVESAPCIKINEQDFGISRRMTHSALGERWARFEDFATNLLLSLDNKSWMNSGYALVSRTSAMWIVGFVVALSIALLRSTS